MSCHGGCLHEVIHSQLSSYLEKKNDLEDENLEEINQLIHYFEQFHSFKAV